MKTLSGETIGDIHIIVCQTPEGQKFFQINADTEDVLPILDIIEDTLSKY